MWDSIQKPLWILAHASDLLLEWEKCVYFKFVLFLVDFIEKSTPQKKNIEKSFLNQPPKIKIILGAGSEIILVHFRIQIIWP